MRRFAKFTRNISLPGDTVSVSGKVGYYVVRGLFVPSFLPMFHTHPLPLRVAKFAVLTHLWADTVVQAIERLITGMYRLAVAASVASFYRIKCF